MLRPGTALTRHIDAGWKAYRRAVLPADLSGRQLERLREAYFAGAAVLWQSVMLGLDPDSEPTEADMARMAELQAEIDTFGAELDQKYLHRQKH